MHKLALIAFATILIPTAAWAATCDNGASACDGGDTNDVCQLKYGTPDASVVGSVYYFECDLMANGDSDDATLNAYTDSSSITYYWGTDADSNDYCCADQTASYLRVNGSSYDDTIDLNFGSDTVSGYSNTYLWGVHGDDTITGSDDSSTTDKIGGGLGSDTIYGLDGGDFIYGGGGRDFLYGGDGLDQMWGNDGADDMWGGNDDDNMDGGTGDDRLKGGNDDDDLYGMDDDDLLCGEAEGAHGNNLYGGNHDDTMHAGGPNSAPSGGAGFNDDCGNVGYTWTYGCESRTQSSCPW